MNLQEKSNTDERWTERWSVEPFDHTKCADAMSRTLIVGCGHVAEQLSASLESTGKYTVIGFIQDLENDETESFAISHRILGSIDNIPFIVKHFGIHELIVASEPSRLETIMHPLLRDRPDLTCRMVPTAWDAMLKSKAINSWGDIALVDIHSAPHKRVNVIRRIFDVVVSIFGLVAFAPLMGILGALVALTSKGAIIFKQQRVGRYGVPFTIYKFRTMRSNAEVFTGPVLSDGRSDPRLTPLGKWLRAFRLDELPQLFNVLIGDMSLVGPRPERPAFVDKFEHTIPGYGMRHSVRPGITGLAQLHAGYHTSAKDKLRFDLIYISHQSLSYDISIILKTLAAAATGRSEKIDD